jgi:dTDP-glucose pyrophosphorylase
MILKKKKLSSILLNENQTMNDAIVSLNKSGLKIVCVINKKNFFKGIVTDGDIRRAILKKINLDSSIKEITNYSPKIYKDKFNLTKIKNKIENENLDHLPIVRKQKLITIYINKKTEATENSVKKLGNFLIIMAGGRGTRLKPLTNFVPKALLKFKNKPLVEHLIESTKKKGVTNFILSVFYKKKMIKEYLQSKNSLGVNISYIEEKTPLGTIGSIKLIKKINKSFFVFNCDSIVDINLEELIKHHNKSNSMLTIVIKNYKYNNPYGVIKSLNHKFISFEEKPSINFNINCGIYVFKPAIVKIIKKYNINNIVELINILKKEKHRISIFPIYEDWADFGQDKQNLKI